jgi:hypothetical protein
MASRKSVVLMLAGCCLCGNTLAASVQPSVVYGNSGTFIKEITITDNFNVDVQGLYQATLSDLENKLPFDQSSLEVKSNGDSLGSLSSPGTFTFEAGPGGYAVDIFASVPEVTVSDEEMERLVEEARQAGGRAWWQSLSREQKAARKALWSTWTEEEMQAHQELVEKRYRRRVKDELVSMSQGEYAVEIALLNENGASHVPVPPAVWLFVSGLVAMAGVARKK